MLREAVQQQQVLATARLRDMHAQAGQLDEPLLDTVEVRELARCGHGVEPATLSGETK